MGIPQKGRALHAAFAVNPRVPTSLAVIVVTLPQPIQDRQPLMRPLQVLGQPGVARRGDSKPRGIYDD